MSRFEFRTVVTFPIHARIVSDGLKDVTHQLSRDQLPQANNVDQATSPLS